MNELRILLAAMSAGNMVQVREYLQREDCDVRYEHATDALALDSQLQQHWDVLIVDSSSAELTIESVVHALRCRKLDIPFIVLNDGATAVSLAAAMRLGAQDCIALDQLPSVEREMVSAVLRSSLREQVVTDYLMQEIDQLILQGYDLPSLKERICRRMAELFEFKLVWIGTKVPDGRVEVVAVAGESLPGLYPGALGRYAGRRWSGRQVDTQQQTGDADCRIATLRALACARAEVWHAQYPGPAVGDKRRSRGRADDVLGAGKYFRQIDDQPTVGICRARHGGDAGCAGTAGTAADACCDEQCCQRDVHCAPRRRDRMAE